MAATSAHGVQWNHDFPRLARDAGFTFDTRRNKVITNWNDIKVIDIDRIIHERDFTTIDEHLTQVLDCQLEKEFDVRILDSGFVKLFRLAQLSVEYLVQCRRLLDTSVASLRGQIKDMAEEVEYLKKLLRSKEEEIRKLRNRTKKHQKAMDYVRTSDITNIFRKMVMNDGHSARSAVDDPIMDAFHKCHHCDKVFLNQFYLHSHLSRRHPNKGFEKTLETNSPEVSPMHESKYKAETERLLQEIKELKERVNATERRLNTNEIIVDNDLAKLGDGTRSGDGRDMEIKEDKVEMDSMEKETVAKMIFESWKKEEEIKFKEQIDALKKQLEDVIRESNTQKEDTRQEKNAAESKEIVRMNEMLKRQEDEMKILKEQLQQKANQDAAELKRNLEDQEKIWRQKLRDAEEEHKKRMEEVNKNMSSLMSDAKLLQQQYMNRIELLEADTTVQKRLLEEQTKKLNAVQQEKVVVKESHSLKSPEKRQNFQDLKKSRVGESTETLPPYDEGSMESILKENLRQDSHNKTSQIMVKNVSTTDDSVMSYNVHNTPEPNVIGKTSPKQIKHIETKRQNESSDEEMPQRKAKKSLFPDINDKKNVEKIKEKSRQKVKQLLSPVKNDQSAKKKKIVEDDGSGSDGEMFEEAGRSRTPSSLKSFQRNSSNRESQRERVMKAVRNDLVLILNKRLQQMGVAKNNKTMSKDVFEKNMAAVKQREQLFAKKYDNYNKIKKKIVSMLDEKAKGLKKQQRTPVANKEMSKSTTSLNKVGSLLSNVKNKAISKIKGIKKSANKSLLTKTKQQNISNLRSPVKNSYTNSDDKLKVSSASIMSLADNLNKNNNSARELVSDSLASETESSGESSEEESEPDHKQIVTTAITHAPSTSIENLLNSPIKKPLPLNRNDREVSVTSSTPTKKVDNKALHFGDLSDVDERKNAANKITKSEENVQSMYAGATSTSDDFSDYEERPDIRKVVSEENISSARAQSQKSVLKSTVSTSALAKKKVLFDLDANQIKSRSTSPSVSAAIEVKTKTHWEHRANENTDDDTDSDWNLSNEDIMNPLNDATLYKLPTDELKLSTKQSPKIAEISKTIGQQLGARTMKPPVGSVDTLFKPQTAINSNSPKRANLYGDSATSIGSSAFEGTNLGASTSKTISTLPVPKPRSLQVVKDKIDSDLELSDWSIEDLLNK